MWLEVGFARLGEEGAEVFAFIQNPLAEGGDARAGVAAPAQRLWRVDRPDRGPMRRTPPFGRQRNRTPAIFPEIDAALGDGAFHVSQARRGLIPGVAST